MSLNSSAAEESFRENQHSQTHCPENYDIMTGKHGTAREAKEIADD
jgi:hypothetical protein